MAMVAAAEEETACEEGGGEGETARRMPTPRPILVLTERLGRGDWRVC